MSDGRLRMSRPRKRTAPATWTWTRCLRRGRVHLDSLQVRQGSLEARRGSLEVHQDTQGTQAETIEKEKETVPISPHPPYTQHGPIAIHSMPRRILRLDRASRAIASPHIRCIMIRRWICTLPPPRKGMGHPRLGLAVSGAEILGMHRDRARLRSMIDIGAMIRGSRRRRLRVGVSSMNISSSIDFRWFASDGGLVTCGPGRLWCVGVGGWVVTTL